MSDIYGPLFGRHTLEAGVLTLLRTWIVPYLAAIERDDGLPPQSIQVPPGPSSFRGAVDHDTFTLETEWFPLLIVGCEPAGPPERAGAGEYGQMFDIRVAVIVGDDDEDAARRRADQYGIAIATLVAQHGSIGGVAGKTVLTGYPDLSYLDPEVRQMICCTIIFRSWVDVVLSEQYGPSVPPADPYAAPGSFPVVASTLVGVLGVEVDDPLP